MTATEICKLLLGRNIAKVRKYYDKENQEMINMNKFSAFILASIKQETMMKTKGLTVIRNNYLVISIISCGVDI